jgi:hypothetical protein
LNLHARSILHHNGTRQGAQSSKMAQECRHQIATYHRGEEKWLGLFEQLFPKDKWSHGWVNVLGKAPQS